METLEQTQALAQPLNDTGISVKGYQILIEIPNPEEKRGLIHIPISTRQKEQAGGVIGHVLEVGPEAYLDTEKFPAGARCKVGDYVVMSSYTGVRFDLNVETETTRSKRDLRLIDDTAVLATVPSAHHVERG